ncbi:endonuclease/exonuclease/phosphatase family protein [Mycobacterium sp. SMC-13]|uniref:endonuclease/exonuclease/phosphatase family protein n=1 Tax=Mycobacterium sp. SMC-13 TaxID=3381626 RepID=UPI00387724BF
MSRSAVLSGLGVIGLLVAIVSLIARFTPIANIAQLVVAIATPYTPLVLLSSLTIAAIHRQVLASVASTVVLALALAIQVPWYCLGLPESAGRHTQLRVLSSNVHDGDADAPFLVKLAAESADVICVSELTPEELVRFRAAGIDENFPFSVLKPAPLAEGIGLWSRYPLSEFVWANSRTTGASARMRIAGVRQDVVVASVHVISPIAFGPSSIGEWRRHIDATRAQLSLLAGSAGSAAVIVAGDFNSTVDMRQFRDLLTDGYRDAAEQTRAGFAPTFPSNRTWMPPVIEIDHVLTRMAPAVSFRTVDVPGSDHRALLVSVAVPAESTVP